jgi:carboxypeptidase family protein
MTTRRGKVRIAILAASLLLALAGASVAAAAEDTRYRSVTLRGRLTEPATGEPMVGATIKFTPEESGGSTVQAVTDKQGNFVLQGLGYGSYSVEIDTADGEQIRGISSFPVKAGTVEVVLKLSDRIASSTKLENRPERFVAVVERKGVDWRRFWKQFAIFFGIAAGLGVAAN